MKYGFTLFVLFFYINTIKGINTNPSDLNINSQIGEIIVIGDGQNVCENESSIQLIVGAIGATSYEWFLDKGGIISAHNIISIGKNTFLLSITKYTPRGTNKLYVQALDLNGSRSELKEVSYTVGETPSNLGFSGATEYCAGEVVEIEPSAANANSYEFATDSNFNYLVPSSMRKGNKLRFVAYKAGETTYYYRATNASGCITEIKSFTINIKPKPTNFKARQNKTTVCVGGVIYFEVGANGATKFLWWKDRLATTPLESQYIKGSLKNKIEMPANQASSGSLWVQAVSTSGCIAEPIRVDYTVLAKPAIRSISVNKGGNLFFVGDKISIAINARNYTHYRILKNSDEIPPLRKGNVNNYLISSHSDLGSAGTYTVEVSNGICSAKKDINIYVVNSVKIYHNREDRIKTESDGTKVVELYKNDWISFWAGINNSKFSYLWLFGDGFNEKGNRVTHYYYSTGIYTPTLKVTYLPTGYEFIVQLSEKIKVIETNNLRAFPRGVFEASNKPINKIDQLKENKILIFPNPFKEELTLKLKSKVKTTGMFKIYSNEGHSLLEKHFNIKIGLNNFKFRNLPKILTHTINIYYAEIKIGNKRKIIKIVKK